jgi:tRNA(Ile)-lysidine synthase
MKRHAEIGLPLRLERLVDETIARYGLISDGESILVGVSGGPDSVALLHLLAARASAGRLRLGVAHLDHGLRPESVRDADFVRTMAVELGLEVYVERVDVAQMQERRRLSIEEAGREARYEFFRQTAGRFGFAKVALGHHADDNAETLLLHLLRGSGRLGLGSIRAVREGVYIRPLIRATREEIEAYVRIRKLPFRIDRTNTDTTILRNRIRHRLLPLLESEYRPGVRVALRRTAEVLADEEVWIEALLGPLLTRLTTSHHPDRLTLAAGEFGQVPPAAARRIVRAAVRAVQGDLRRIGFAHVEQIIRLSRRRGEAGPLHLPGDLRVRIDQNELVFERRSAPGWPDRRPEATGDYEYALSGCGVLTIQETGERISLSEVRRDAILDPKAAAPRTAFLDRNAVHFPVIVRNRRPGDRFEPLGAGGTQKLKKFFSDHKVPAAVRRRCPLLVSNGRILWVAGHRIDQQAQIGRHSRSVLKAELLLAN